MAVLSGSEVSPHVKQALELVRCQLVQHGSDYSREAAVKYAQTCPIDRAALPSLSFRVAAAEVEERINQTAQQLYPQLLGLQARRKFLAEILRPLASRIGDQQVADAVKKHSNQKKEPQPEKPVSSSSAEKQRSQTAPRLRPSTAPASAVRSPRQTDSPGTPPLGDSRSARISARTEQNRLAQAAAMLGRRADGTAEPLGPIKERQSSARPSSSMRSRTLISPTPLKTSTPHPHLPRAPRTPSSPVGSTSLRVLLEEEGLSSSDRSADLAVVRVNNGVEATQQEAAQGLVAEAGSKRDPTEDGVRLYALECCAASHTGVQTYRDSFRSAANALQEAPKLPALSATESSTAMIEVAAEKPVTPKGKARLSPSQSVDMPTSEVVVDSIQLQPERETPASGSATLTARLRESNALVRTKALGDELALIPAGKSPRSHAGQSERHSPKAFMSPEFVVTPSPLRKGPHGRATAEKAAAASQVSKQNLIVRWQQQQQLADVTIARLDLREQTLLDTHRHLLNKVASLEEFATEANCQLAEHMREVARMEVVVRTREQQYTAAETALRQRIQTLQLTEQELLDADNQVQLRLQEVKQREEALLAAQLRLNDDVASNATRTQALDMLSKKIDAQEKALAERERKVAQREQQISLTGSNLSRWYQEMAEIQASKEFSKESAS
eukprot:jgi/Chlat1/8191/Chrsp76S07659